MRKMRSKSKQSEAYLDKVRGCLIGGAAGDALGYPVEFMGEDQYLKRLG
jgi:ADP-ribosylglycohydrolase